MTMSLCIASIDWAATGAMLQGWGTLAGVVAVIWAAQKGASTFDNWRKQKIAERKQEQAERILTATYKCRRALEYVRGVMMFGHELHAAEEQMKEKDGWASQGKERQKRLVMAQAYYNRLNRTKDERDELDQCLPMARALFGEELEKKLETLNHQFWIVQVDVESYVDDEDGTDKAFTAKIRRGMYAVKPREGEVNEVTDATETSVAAIERICLPVLRLES
jgi:hypothetical protein